MKTILFFCLLCISSQNLNSQKKISGGELISKLEKLNFFNLTDEEDLKSTKLAFKKSYVELNFFEGKMKGETTFFTDNRFHFIDAEELFEIGGLLEYLKQVKTTFDSLNLKLDFKNEKSYQTESYWKHTIELNEVEYIAFEGDFSTKDWDFAYVNFIKMLNSELEKQHSKEKFYPISLGNDGRMALLTRNQFIFVKSIFPNDNEHPKKLNTWIKDNNL